MVVGNWFNMHTKHRLTLLLIIISAFFGIAADEPPPTFASAEVEAELSAAYAVRLESETALQALTGDQLTPEIDTAFISPDGQTAVIWVALRDNTGRILGTEPGLLLATMTDSGWQVLLPGDAGWDETMAAVPQSMLPAEQSPMPEAASITPNAELQALTGYYLPWAAGTQHWLEGSIIHVMNVPQWGYPSCNPVDACAYAYDFTDYGHFPLLASKGGSVVQSRDSCADNTEGCTNYIVLYTASDNAYQIYLHLAHGTIPDQLTNGTPVVRGQYLGDTDDTGYSTSNHVHFMVVQNPWTGREGYYWGYSIDIRFADVSINNGIPRTCYEIIFAGVVNGASECTGSKSDPYALHLNLYTSGNVGAYPATGTINRPEPNKIVATGSNPLMDASAYVYDDVRVKALRYVAKINGIWKEIGPQVIPQDGTDYYDYDINLCEAGPLNGWLEVGLRIWDHEGNVTTAADPRWIFVDQACPGQLYLPLVRR